MPAVDTESVLRFIRMHGPVLPVQIAKEIKQNSMMAGAVLSELVSSGKLKISKLKVGGSPLYFPPGQESRLMSFTGHLDSKDRQTCDLLRHAGVLQDNALDSLTRVSLRALKDFSKPLQVTIDGKQEVFWKWYMLSDSQAEQQIKTLLGIDSKPSEAEPHLLPPISADDSLPLPALEQSPQSSITGTEYEDPSPVNPIQGVLQHHETPQLAQPQKQTLSRVKGQTKLPITHPSTPPLLIPPPFLPPHTEQPPFHQPPAYASDPFYKRIDTYLANKSIHIQSTTCLKKSDAYSYILTVPSQLGNLTYYCTALNKKRVSESDITAAFLSSQLCHLPGIILTTGQLTKSAQALLSTKLHGLHVANL